VYAQRNDECGCGHIYESCGLNREFNLCDTKSRGTNRVGEVRINLECIGSSSSEIWNTIHGCTTPNWVMSLHVNVIRMLTNHVRNIHRAVMSHGWGDRIHKSS
jgi:hypothetical protein